MVAPFIIILKVIAPFIRTADIAVKNMAAKVTAAAPENIAAIPANNFICCPVILGRVDNLLSYGAAMFAGLTD